MADNRLNKTGLQYFWNRIKTIFATKTEVSDLSDRVDDIVSEGGEPNTIETVKVNGTALTPDASKAVNVTVPTKTSDLTNDGDGTSNFATEDYVAQNGGKIDKIQVNGTEQSITNKTVNIPVPTKTSDIANDSDYQTAAQVQAAIAAMQHLTKKVVDTLPATGEDDVLYLVPDDHGGANKDMYIWNGSAFQLVGNTETDLSGYWNETNLPAITTAEIDAIVDGE